MVVITTAWVPYCLLTDTTVVSADWVLFRGGGHTLRRRHSTRWKWYLRGSEVKLNYGAKTCLRFASVRCWLELVTDCDWMEVVRCSIGGRRVSTTTNSFVWECWFVHEKLLHDDGAFWWSTLAWDITYKLYMVLGHFPENIQIIRHCRIDKRPPTLAQWSRLIVLSSYLSANNVAIHWSWIYRRSTKLKLKQKWHPVNHEANFVQFFLLCA